MAEQKNQQRKNTILFNGKIKGIEPSDKNDSFVIKYENDKGENKHFYVPKERIASLSRILGDEKNNFKKAVGKEFVAKISPNGGISFTFPKYGLEKGVFAISNGHLAFEENENGNKSLALSAREGFKPYLVQFDTQNVQALDQEAAGAIFNKIEADDPYKNGSIVATAVIEENGEKKLALMPVVIPNYKIAKEVENGAEPAQAVENVVKAEISRANENMVTAGGTGIDLDSVSIEVIPFKKIMPITQEGSFSINVSKSYPQKVGRYQNNNGDYRSSYANEFYRGFAPTSEDGVWANGIAASETKLIFPYKYSEQLKENLNKLNQRGPSHQQQAQQEQQAEPEPEPKKQSQQAPQPGMGF